MITVMTIILEEKQNQFFSQLVMTNSAVLSVQRMGHAAILSITKGLSVMNLAAYELAFDSSSTQ